MRLYEKEASIPKQAVLGGRLDELAEAVDQLTGGDIPIRVALTHSDDERYYCELGLLGGWSDHTDLVAIEAPDIFGFRHRAFENGKDFNAVLIIPTGIGAEIGGHAGDANPVARLLAATCDTLITHPNVVNASDINELPENGLYVEGSVIARLMSGTVGLAPVRANRVLLVISADVEKSVVEVDVNVVSAARASLGMECAALLLDPSYEAKIRYTSSGRAAGTVENIDRLFTAVAAHQDEYDAIALASVVEVPPDIRKNYFKLEEDLVNPWGGAEAMITHALSSQYSLPTAHAPIMRTFKELTNHYGIVDPRKAAECISVGFLYCVLKGLQRAPHIVRDPFGIPGAISARDISCLIIPDGCIGLPVLAALEQGIPIIAVRENRNKMQNDLTKLPFGPGKLIIVDNYLEAAGIMTAMRAGVAQSTVRRPISGTEVLDG